MIHGECERAWQYIRQADDLTTPSFSIINKCTTAWLKTAQSSVQNEVVEHFMVLGDTRPEIIHLLMNLLLMRPSGKPPFTTALLERRYALR